MTDKPQTLAEQIRAMKPLFPLDPQTHAGYNIARSEAATLADAAATTTPVVVGERASYVRQAVRIKPLVWEEIKGNYPSQRVWAFESLQWMWIVQNDGGDYVWCEDVTPSWLPASAVRGVFKTLELAQAAAQADYAARITATLEPDPTPALGWKAMQTAAAEAVAKEAHGETVLGGQRFKTVKLEDAVEAILALPGPTADQLLADAVRLPEVQAVVKCLDREKSLIWIIENTVQVLIRDLALEMLGQQRAALKAWRDGQRPPTEYEQKLAALKKDFPNGI